MKRFVFAFMLYWHLWDLLPQRLVRGAGEACDRRGNAGLLTWNEC